MEQKKKKRSAGKLRMILAVLLLAGMIFPALFAEQENWSGEGGRAEAEEVLEETGLDSGEKAAGGSEDLRETENEPAKDTEKPAAQTEAFQSETVKEEMPEETLQEPTEVSEEDGKDIQESEKMSEDKTAGTETGTEAGASKEETSGTEAQTAAISFGNRQSEGSTALSETAASGKTETKKETSGAVEPETESERWEKQELEPGTGAWTGSESGTESESETESDSGTGSESGTESESQTESDSGTESESETEEDLSFLLDEQWRDGPIRKVGGISLFTARYPTVSRDSSEILSYLGFPCYFKYVTDHGLSVGGKTVAAYCLYNTREAPEDEKYTYEGEGSLSKEITYCLYSGCRYRGSTAYNSKYSAGSWKKDYYITQMAIHIINHEQGRESSIEDYLDQSKDREVYNLVYKMVEDAYADTTIASSVTNQTKEVTYEITPSKQDTWIRQGNGTYRTASSYTCKSNEPDRILDVTRSLEKGTPQGVTIVVEEPENPLSPFYFQATQAAYQSIARDQITVTASVTVVAEEYGGWWYEPADSSVKRQAVTYLSMDFTELEETRKVTATAAELFFSVRIQKTEAGTGAALKGAVYGLYGDEGCKNRLYTFPATDENGRTQLLNLQAEQENYYVKEITAPSAHVLNTQVYKVQSIQEETVIQAEDKLQTASLTIWKEGEVLTGAASDGEGVKFLYENRKIKGAVFTLYAEETILNGAGQKVYSAGDIVRENLRAGADGSVTVNGLPFGVYSLEEKQAPEGMAKSQERYRVELKAPGQTEEVSYHTVTVKNTRTKARIKIYKADSETKNPLAGARFGLYTAGEIKNASGQVIAGANTLIASGLTGQDGFLSFEEEIPWGYSYYAAEIQAPNGYVRNPEARFSLDFRGTGGIAVQEFSYECTNQSCRAKVNLQKVDLETGEAVPQGDASLTGAVYGLFAREDIVHPDGKTGVLHKAGEQAAVLTSDESGRAAADGLYPGKYFLKELKAPEGYVLDEKEYDVACLWENDQTLTIEKSVTIGEQVKKQPFQLIKISQEGADDAPLLKGAGFTVYLLSELKMDEEGEYLLDEAAPVVIGESGETELFTDETGYLQTIPLPYGKYLVRETTVPEEYKPVRDFLVTVSEHSPDQPQPWRVLLDEHFQAKLKVVKRDQETGEILKVPGAKFQILNQDTGEYVKQTVTYPKRETLEVFETNEEGYLILPENLLPGKYSLIETEAPEGYIRNEEPLEFEISSGCAYETDSLTGDVVIVQEYENQPVKGEIQIRKTGEIPEKTEEGLVYKETSLAGVVFDLYAAEDILYADGRTDADGEREILFEKGALAASAVTDEKGEASVKDLPLGIYEIRERKPPETFQEPKEETVAELLWKDQETPVIRWEKDWKNLRQKIEIRVQKKDSEDGTPIEGAVFSLYAAEDILGPDGMLLFDEGEEAARCTTDQEGQGIFEADLPHGKYVIREEQAAPGYVSSRESLEADVRYRDGTAEILEFTGVFENRRTDLQITKTDLTNGEEIEGASLEVRDSEGNVIDQWISEKEPHRIRGLEIGKKYFLTETLPAPGYVTAETIEFTLENTEEIQKVSMQDDITKVEISKQDITDGSEIPGAKLSIVNENGKIVESWISEKEPHQIRRLPAGTYTLREELAPYGYLTAEEVKFTVEDTGEIQKVVMQDHHPMGRLILEKTDQETGEGLKGAVFELRSEEGEVLEKLETDQDGRAESSLLETALYEEGAFQEEITYFLEEIQAPEGYEKEEKIREITFQYEDGKTKEIQRTEEIKNRRTPIPQGDTPRTGDRTGIEFWMGLAGAGGALGGLLLFAGGRAGRRGH